MSCGSRTHLPSLEGWHLCRSAKDTLLISFQRKERESNPQDISGRSAAFEAAAIASWLALPYFHSQLRREDSNLNLLINSQPFYR